MSIGTIPFMTHGTPISTPTRFIAPTTRTIDIMTISAARQGRKIAVPNSAPSTKYKALVSILVFVTLTPASLAATVEEQRINYQKGTYEVVFKVLIKARAQATRTLLDDYENWHSLSQAIEKVELLEDGQRNGARIRITFYNCLLFFCKKVQKVADVMIQGEETITTKALPSKSDFLHAREQIHIQAVGNNTRITYRAEMAPDFFIPPIIGPLLVKRMIRKELHATALVLERRARSSP